MSIAAVIPVLMITTLVQIFKEALGLPSKYARITTFGVAVVFGILFTFSPSITDTVLTIITYGLMAIGLWEVGGQKYKELRGIDTPSTPITAVDSD